MITKPVLFYYFFFFAALDAHLIKYLIISCSDGNSEDVEITKRPKFILPNVLNDLFSLMFGRSNFENGINKNLILTTVEKNGECKA